VNPLIVSGLGEEEKKEVLFKENLRVAFISQNNSI